MADDAAAAKVDEKPIIKKHDLYLAPVVSLIPNSYTPNHLSVLRFILCVPLIILMYRYFYKTAAVLFLFAALLDALDGSMARLRNQCTEFGAYIDPIADKAVNFAVWLRFLFNVQSDIYTWLITLIITIDSTLFCIATLKHLIKNVFPTVKPEHWLYKFFQLENIRRNVEIKKTGANQFGKIKMILQVVSISLLLFFNPLTSIKIHDAYSIIPDQLTLLEISFPLLIACIVFGILSLHGHLQAISFKND